MERWGSRALIVAVESNALCASGNESPIIDIVIDARGRTHRGGARGR